MSDARRDFEAATRAHVEGAGSSPLAVAARRLILHGRGRFESSVEGSHRLVGFEVEVDDVLALTLALRDADALDFDPAPERAAR